MVPAVPQVRLYAATRLLEIRILWAVWMRHFRGGRVRFALRRPRLDHRADTLGQPRIPHGLRPFGEFLRPRHVTGLDDGSARFRLVASYALQDAPQRGRDPAGDAFPKHDAALCPCRRPRDRGGSGANWSGHRAGVGW